MTMDEQLPFEQSYWDYLLDMIQDYIFDLVEKSHQRDLVEKSHQRDLAAKDLYQTLMKDVCH